MISLRSLLGLCALGAAACTPAQVVLGKEGKAIKNTLIYSSPSSYSRVYSRARVNSFLVVKPTEGRYFAVLLQNGGYGYVPKFAVHVLPYVVVSKKPVRDQSTSSRGATCSVAQYPSIAQYGEQFIGAPYKWGGTDPNSGIDCSAFVRKLYGDVAGVKLPRTAAEQATVGQKISRLEDLQPGDRLYFWEAKRNMIGHTGVYIGGGYFLHSSHGKGGVSTSYLTDSWRHLLVAARR